MLAPPPVCFVDVFFRRPKRLRRCHRIPVQPATLSGVPRHKSRLTVRRADRKPFPQQGPLTHRHAYATRVRGIFGSSGRKALKRGRCQGPVHRRRSVVCAHLRHTIAHPQDTSRSLQCAIAAETVCRRTSASKVSADRVTITIAFTTDVVSSL